MRPADRLVGYASGFGRATIVSFVLTLLLAWLFPLTVLAQSPDIDAALTYLNQTQSSDGSWSSSNLKAASVTTSRAAEALLRWRDRSPVSSDATLARAWARLATADTNRTENLDE